MPVLGQGTWGMGEKRGAFDAEVAALQLGLDLGMTLIDTAEMYGEGGAEEVVAEAIAGRRDEVFLVSKVYPHNASRRGAVAACERSLKRLKTDRLDLYLLHWRGGDAAGGDARGVRTRSSRPAKIRDWGVSNFDTDDMEELAALPGGDAVATNQVLYNLDEPRHRMGPAALVRERAHPGHGLFAVRSAPPALTRLLGNAALKAVAARHDATPAQIALAWLLHQPGVVAIPKAVQPAHVRAQPRGLRPQLTAETSPTSTAPSRRRARRCRWRCCRRSSTASSTACLRASLCAEAGSRFAMTRDAATCLPPRACHTCRRLPSASSSSR